jgi:hypothetical protein
LKKLIFLFAFILISLGPCNPGPGGTTGATLDLAFKGYELYSWQEEGEWVFALVLGTNRLKTHAEVTAEANHLDFPALMAKLAELPPGEQVFWLTNRIPGMALPSEAVVSELSTFCMENGIEIAVEH